MTPEGRAPRLPAARLPPRSPPQHGMSCRSAQDDPVSMRLAQAQIAAETQSRQLAAQGRFSVATAPSGPLAQARSLANQLQARQLARQATARADARSSSRRALLLVAIAGVLAIVGALALIAGLVRGMRRRSTTS